MTLGTGIAVLPGSASAATGHYITFDSRASGAIFDFTALVPDVLPLEATGGILAATASARQGPLALGIAGVAPVPALTSLGIIVPQKDPVTGQPIPQQIQDGARSVDYTKLPNYCQASFPASGTTTTEASCGGPAQDDPSLGFTLDAASGRVSATGDPDEALSAVTEALSRGAGAGVSPVGVRISNYEARAAAGLNTQGIPEALSSATIAGFRLLGDTVRLDGIHSETDIAFDGTKEGYAGTSNFSVQKASIFGVPVTIDSQGFTIAGENAGDPAATRALIDQLNSAFNVEQFTLRTFPPTALTRDGSKVSMSSGGIEFSYLTDAVRYSGRIGYTTASVVAVPTPAAAGGSTDTVAGANGGTAPAMSGAGAANPVAAGIDGVSAAAGIGAVPEVTGTVPTANVPPPDGVAGFAQQAGNAVLLSGIPVGAVVALPAEDLNDLYVAFAAVVALTAVLCRVRAIPFLRRGDAG
ncbi:hypothetical protein [Sporichthya polymorpha]|uniref:hypothetical protein n=1 Tax=Sporichthya polymorpha TaxID=35751 RepID=UPI0012EC2439|nr:hypothetical protein [Sporichthya polymorpha]